MDKKRQEPWKVLIVDDDEDIHIVTKMVLDNFIFEGRPIEIISAYTATEAKILIKKHRRIAVSFIDVVMESDDAGLKLVEYIRQSLNNVELQIILRTGQPGLAPEEAVIRDYEINDYRSKTELTATCLAMSLTTALRAFRNIIIAKHNQNRKVIAEETSKAKSKFLALMIHEIRTPLNAVLGINDILSHTQLNEVQRGYVNTIKSSGKLLVCIINDFLDFSKIEAGKLKIEKIRFNLKTLVRDIDSLFSYQVKKSGLDFVIVVNSQLPEYIIGDPTRIRQIIFNLISNSIKFTEKGKIEVGLKFLRNGKSQSKLFCYVKDTGIGISAENMLKIFNSYSQADSSIARKYGGTGLGLEICKSLVELMNGKIKVKSRLGSGTTFSFYCDCKLSEVAEDSLGITSANEVNNSVKLLNVLLVDDNPVNQTIGVSLLQRLGHNVKTANNGLEATKEVENNKFDIILMDCQMPILDGFEATKQLKKNDNSKNVPIIAITASYTEQDFEECLKSGMSDVLTKPYKEKELTDIFNKWAG